MIIARGLDPAAAGVRMLKPMALEAALARRARGATLYVTLEPCSHSRPKTPPCADAAIVVRVSIARVVSAIEDPDPRKWRDAAIALLA